MEKKFTEEELLYLVTQLYEDKDIPEVDKKFEELLFTALFEQAPALRDYLKAMMVGDVRRYFIAPNDAVRAEIKGQFKRTAYLLAKMSVKKKPEKDVKLDNPRYNS